MSKTCPRLCPHVCLSDAHWSTGGSRARVWLPQSERGARIYNGVWGWVDGQSHRSGIRVAIWSWTPFCIITNWGVGQFVLKSVFAQKKISSDVWGTIAPTAPLGAPVHWSLQVWFVSERQIKLCYHGSYMSALAMGSSHNRALYSVRVLLLLFFLCGCAL